MTSLRDALSFNIVSDEGFLTEWLSLWASSFMLDDNVSSISDIDAERIGTTAKINSNLIEVEAAGIQGYSRVDKVSSEFFTGHVYNLQSNTGWYTIHRNLIIHNCRCIMRPIIPGDDD